MNKRSDWVAIKRKGFRLYGSMRRTLLLLVLAVLVPMIGVQTEVYRDRFESRLMKEYQSNLEFARVVAIGFERFVQDILRQELAIGEALLLLEPFSAAEATEYLQKNTEDYKSVHSFSWVEPDGQVTLSSLSEVVGLNIGHREYYQKILKGSEWAISDLLKPVVGSDLSFIIARGIYGENKQLKGIVIAVIEPEKISELAFTVKRFEEGATLIFDRQGTVVYRYPRIPLTPEERKAWGKADPSLRVALQGRETTGFLVSPADGVKRIKAHVPIKSIGWVAGASRPEAVAMSEVMKGLHYQIFLVIGVGLFSFLLAMVISRRIAFQTQLLREHALAIGRGLPEPEIGIHGIAELEDVADAVKHMAGQLEERRKAVEEAAEETRRRANELDAVFAAMVQGVIICDSDGRMTKVNPTVSHTLGFDPINRNHCEVAEKVGLRYPDGRLISEENLPLSRALRRERVVGERIVFTGVRGRDVIVLMSAVPLQVEEVIAGAVLVWQDVTELERLLRELRKSEEKYRELVQNANSIILRLDPQGNVTFFNEYARQFFGYEEEEILGRNIIGSIVPETDSSGRELAEIIHEIVRRPEGYTRYENENICRDGRRVWIAWTNRPVYDQQGRLKEIFTVGIDATDRKKAEDALRQSEQRFRRLAETSTFGLVIGDIHGEVSYVNSAVTQMLGYTAEEFELGKIRWSEVTPAEFRELDVRAVRELETNGYFTPFEKSVIASDGTRVPVFIGGAVLERKEEGEMTVAWFLTDLTQLKQAQEALLRAYDDLEIRVRERTAELTRSNEELARFAYVASHDLQEPLRMVASYVQLLEHRYKDRLDEEANQYIEYAIDGANRMRGLIKAILEYSRVSTQARPFKPTDCERVLTHVLQNLSLLIRETQTRVTHDELPTVAADETQLTQVFQNLIENGIKFRRKGIVPEVHVSAERKDSEWLFSVRDNGIGIEKDYYDQIFMIFKQLHARGKYTGVGVGLSIVKRIVERHGGTVWVESVFGEGTTFYFTLPVR